MFDPVPDYETFSENEEAAKEALNAFHTCIEFWAHYFDVDWTNRFICILDICTKLESTLKNEGKGIWKRPAKEAKDSFQNLFQLLIYALGDCGLLYNEYGIWNNSPDFDFWQESEQSYWGIALAMRQRNLAYHQLQELRKNLAAHANTARNYPERLPAQTAAEEMLTDCDIRIWGRKYFPQIPFELLKNTIRKLLDIPQYKQIAPLFLFFALSREDGTWYDVSEFRACLKRNTKLQLKHWIIQLRAVMQLITS